MVGKGADGNVQGRDICPGTKGLVHIFLTLEPPAWRSRNFSLPFQVYSQISLEHWSQKRQGRCVIFVPRRHLARLEILVVTTERKGFLAPSGSKPTMLLNALQYTEQPPQQRLVWPNVSWCQG